MAQPESTKHENTKPKIIEERLGRSSITVTMDTYGHLRTPNAHHADRCSPKLCGSNQER
jgi:hypothetical protein